MRILAFSDVRNWDKYTRLVDQHEPSVVVLAGDLTSDGGADFWHTALERIPRFRAERQALERRLGRLRSRAKRLAVLEELSDLAHHYRETRAFRAARKRIHVDRFYKFLEYAGTVAEVLVVKGDHDDDFAGDYDPQRIDAIPGCTEISGKTRTIRGWTFLGLGFDQAGYRRPLRTLISEFRHKARIVIAHAPQKNVRLIAELQPRLIIRGHFGAGRFVIDGVPAVFTAVDHALIELGTRKVAAIHYAGSDWLERELRRTYDWLKPYPPSSR